MSFEQLLASFGACSGARLWANGKTWPEVYATCERGDWLCWLFARTNPSDLQLFSLVNGHQANLVRHLMDDERSLKAIDTAIAFGQGLATLEELGDATQYAREAYNSFESPAFVAYAAVCETSYGTAAYAANFTTDREDTLRKCADIVRQHIPIELWNIEG